jgi:SAM-dependent methyltransferase
VYPQLRPEDYRAVFDFGCGCGRTARQLMLQRPPPERYVGIDLHPELVGWCREHLEPRAPNFSFHHHDVRDVLFNPGEDKPELRPFPAGDREFTLVNAHSVFTHLVEPHADHYLRETARILHPEGVLHASFFLFDKLAFPMMDGDHNALYVSHAYPPTAVIYDRGWLTRASREAGLVITGVEAPEVRGYQWLVKFQPARPGLTAVELPPG